tara:strand:+ start:1988 stop:2242 length:255 start_codon:yes stop_codon:yes gene_type:complete
MELYENIHKNHKLHNLSLEYNSSVNIEFLNKKKVLINNYERYLNTINHKCITNSCKRRHEEIYGNFINSINDLEYFKVNVINKI